MNTVEISCEEVEPPHWLPKLNTFTEAALARLKLTDWELSIVLTSDAFIRGLNREYRSKDEPTDVLSFLQEHEGEAPPVPSFDTPEAPSAPRAVGDIVVSLETVAANAERFETAFDEELQRVVLHGILHLAGYTHSDNTPEQPMLELQERILSELAEEHAL